MARCPAARTPYGSVTSCDMVRSYRRRRPAGCPAGRPGPVTNCYILGQEAKDRLRKFKIAPRRLREVQRPPQEACAGDGRNVNRLLLESMTGDTEALKRCSSLVANSRAWDGKALPCIAVPLSAVF